MNSETKSSGGEPPPPRSSPGRRAWRWIRLPFAAARTSAVVLLFVASLGMFVGGIAVAASKVLFNLASNAASLVSRQTVRADHDNQVRSARNELDRVTQEANNNKSRVSALERENADLKRQSVVTYRGQQKRVGDAVSETAKKVTDRLKIASSRNVAAMPAEAIPYFGIAVIVGATAWELKDACELMKDMRELDAAFNPSNPISEDAVCGMTPPTREEIWTAVRQSPGSVWAKAATEFPELQWPEIALPEWASVSLPEWPSVSIPEWPEIELPDIGSRVGTGWKWLNCSTWGGEDCGD